MNDHEHQHHDHAPSRAGAQDAGSQALAEALRSSFAIVKIVMVLMVVAFFCSGFFTVGPSEKAVILAFRQAALAKDKMFARRGIALVAAVSD